METTNWDSKSIYHYTTLSTAMEFILPGRQLLLNPAGKTNDPRENKSFVFASANVRVQGYFDIEIFNDDFTSQLRKNCRVLCFSSDDPPYFGYEFSRLWALYGGNHTGVCIQLDKEAFLRENRDKISKGLFKRVQYWKLNLNEILPHIEIDHEVMEQVGLKRYVEGFRAQYSDRLFFTKNDEWASEREYRLIYFTENNENEYCTIKDSLSGIHLGIDFKEVYMPALKAICKDIPFYKMEFPDVRLTRVHC